jgi:hypothetical protein
VILSEIGHKNAGLSTQQSIYERRPAWYEDEERADAEGPPMGAHDVRYSSAFTRIREAVAALPMDNAVLDGEAS